MFTSYSKETSRSFCVCMLEEHQSSVEASPGGGDAFLCCCSSVLCSEDPQLARTDHPLLWYIWTLLPSISLSLSLVLVWLRPIDTDPGIRFSVLNILDGLRRILCQVGLQSGPQGASSSLVDQLMLNDSKMWKGTHTQSVLVLNLFSLKCWRTLIHLLLQEQGTSTTSCWWTASSWTWSTRRSLLFSLQR